MLAYLVKAEIVTRKQVTYYVEAKNAIRARMLVRDSELTQANEKMVLQDPQFNPEKMSTEVLGSKEIPQITETRIQSYDPQEYIECGICGAETLIDDAWADGEDRNRVQCGHCSSIFEVSNR